MSPGRGEQGPTPAARLHGISKRFGPVVACDDVELSLHGGRIHGILGENGAGKSTLMKILIGLVVPDSGTIEVDGERHQVADPLDAARLGIAMVHQHFSLVEALTVWENVALGDAGRLNAAAVRDRIGDIATHYGLGIEPDAVVGDLPVGMRQRVEIIKCLRRDPHILIFDEPTSVLTPAESEQLFGSLRDVIVGEGRAVALVSHKLDEILHATDEVTIMRQGRVTARMPIEAADAQSLATAMVGRPVSLRSERVAFRLVDASPGLIDGDRPEPSEPSRGLHAPTVDPAGDSSLAAAPTSPALQLLEVTVRPGSGSRSGASGSANGLGRSLLDGLSLEVGPGEVLGLAGVEGNGQRPLVEVLSSLIVPDRGEIRVDGRRIDPTTPGALTRARVGVIPEDRHDSGLVLDMTVAENLFLIDMDRVSDRGLIDTRQLRDRAAELIAEFDIACDGPDAALWSLSGGNQQRVVLARELSHHPVVLVAAQPTRGLDVGAIEYTTERLRAAAEDGVGILLISSELEEILDLAQRVAVLRQGRIIGEMDRVEVDIERLGLMMGGRSA